MSELIGNGNGRAGGTSAPADTLEKSSGEFKSVTRPHGAAAAHHARPSFPDPRGLAPHAKAGHELLALHGAEDRDRKGRALGKSPAGSGWRTRPSLSLDEAEAHMALGGNVGVRLNGCDLVVDADPRNYRPGDDALARLRADFGLPDCPTVETGGGGFHLYMRKPEDAEVAGSLHDYPGVEFKGLGRQVVAAGSVHPETGRLYAWDPLDDDPSTAPMAPDALLDAVRRRGRDGAAAEAGEHTPEELAALLGGLDACAYGTNDLWLRMAMAAHHATAGLGEDEFVAWCETDPEFADDGERVRKRWASFAWDKSGRAYTARTIYRELHRAGRGDLVEAACRSAPEDDFPDEPEGGGEPKRARDLIDRMNGRFCAVLNGGKFSVFMEDEDGAFDPPRRVWTRLSRETFLHYHEDERVRPMGGKKDLSVAEVWLADPRRRKYPGIVMDPEGRHGDRLNLWRGWAVDPRPGDWSLMRELVEGVLCSGDRASSDFVLRWVAFMLQRPGARPEVAVCFRGDEGTGKGTLGRALMAIAGAHGLTVSSPAQFAGRFNAHLRSVAFLFADEVNWRGSREVEGVLKQLVTEPAIAYEGKGADIVQGRNLVHLMMASNNEWVVPAGLNARRFAVFDVSDRRRGDAAFFRALNAQMDDGGLAAMAHDLLALDLGDWHPSRHVPRTQALADQKAMSLDPASRWWMGLLDRGALPTSDGEAIRWQDGPITLGAVAKAELLDDYDRSLRASDRSSGANASHRALVAAGRALGLETGRRGGGAERTWVLPGLDEARRLFEGRLGASGLFA